MSTEIDKIIQDSMVICEDMLEDTEITRADICFIAIILSDYYGAQTYSSSKTVDRVELIWDIATEISTTFNQCSTFSWFHAYLVIDNELQRAVSESRGSHSDLCFSTHKSTHPPVRNDNNNDSVSSLRNLHDNIVGLCRQNISIEEDDSNIDTSELFCSLELGFSRLSERFCDIQEEATHPSEGELQIKLTQILHRYKGLLSPYERVQACRRVKSWVEIRARNEYLSSAHQNAEKSRYHESEQHQNIIR